MAVERRTVLQGLLATGANIATLKMPAVLAQGAPFKIGLLTVKTGPLAQGGIQMEQGIATLLKEKGNTLAGRNVELLVADTGGNPAGAKTKAQELIERDKVNVILGPLAAFELLAITDYVRENATPLVSLAAAEDVTQRKANPFVIRPSATSGQCSHAIGDYAAKELNFKRVATISDDFAFGHEQMSAFQRVFEDAGGGFGGQEAVAAASDARLHALHCADRQRRRSVPRPRWLEPAEIHARLRRSRPEG